MNISVHAPDDRERQILKEIIMAVARREDGDPTLRQGRFITEADKNALREAMLAYEFKDLERSGQKIGPNLGGS